MTIEQNVKEKEEKEPKEITIREALEVVIELAEQRALDDRDADNDELKEQRKYQYDCLEVVWNLISNWPWESDDIFDCVIERDNTNIG